METEQKNSKPHQKGLYPFILPDNPIGSIPQPSQSEKRNYKTKLRVISKFVGREQTGPRLVQDFQPKNEIADHYCRQRSASEDRGNAQMSNWVCPDDRQLALRAKLRIGWSVRAESYEKYGSKPKPLSDAEQDIIAAVIKRAEVVEKQEQERIGMLVERLDNIKMKRFTPAGTGTKRCSLCGDKFGLLGSSSMICHDCSKTVCTKCGIETFSTKQREAICLCKICAETREMWKKSGAWFYKSMPKYILPTKTNLFPNNYRRCERDTIWKKATDYQREDEESSSDDDMRTTISAPARFGFPRSNDRISPTSMCSLKNGGNTDLSSASSYKQTKVTFSETGNSLTIQNRMKTYDRTIRREGSLESLSSRTQSTESGGSVPHISVNYCDIVEFGESNIREQLESDRSSNCSTPNSSNRKVYNDNIIDSRRTSFLQKSDDQFGIIKFSLQYDVEASSLHVSLHKAEGLKGSDIHGLSDPFCKLNLFPVGAKSFSFRLRTRTVQRTVNPEFNETLTFYGIVDDKISSQSLHVLIFDDDKYGHDCLGEAMFPLSLLEPRVKLDLQLPLTEHIPSLQEDEVWGEGISSNGQIVLTLFYSTRKRALIVGIIKCMNLIPMDSNGLSDPFVKLWLRSSEGGSSSKCRTCIKWKDLNPVFNEEFVLDTKITDLSTKTLVITVWDKDPGRRNDYLGCLELGIHSKGERLRQWISAIKFPDRKHEGIHNLSDQLIKD